MSSTTHIASKLEQQAIIRFWMYENLPPIKIYRRIKNVYGESTISVQHVRKWYRKFKSGLVNILVKVIQEDQFLLQTRHLKTKLMQSFSMIKKWDYPILRTKWIRHMVLFRISLQKKQKYWKIYSGQRVCLLRNNMLYVSPLAKRISSLSKIKH